MWNAVEEALEVPEVLESYSIESTDKSHGSKLSGKDIASLILEEKDGEKQIFTDTNENLKTIIDHEKETQENEILDNKYNYCNDSTKDVHESTKCSLLENMILDKTVMKDTSISNDEASPSSSNWSVESFHVSDSSGSARDRSMSELSVSVPVRKIMSSIAEKDISALVDELSHVDSSKKDLSEIESVHSSHKVGFSSDLIETEVDESLKSYQSGPKKPISEIILYESSQDEEPGNENCRRLSPRKSGVSSPWFKESLDEIGSYLSSCSSVDVNSYTPRPQNNNNSIISLSCTGTDDNIPANKFMKRIDRTDLESSLPVRRKPAEEYTFIEGILTIESLEDDDNEMQTGTINDKLNLDQGSNIPCDKTNENNVTLCKVCDNPRSDKETGAGNRTQSTNQNAHLEVLESCRCDEESSGNNGQDVGTLSHCTPHDKDIDIGKMNEISNTRNTSISELSSQVLELTSSLKDSKVTSSESASSPEDTEPASSSQHSELSLSKESKASLSKGSMIYSQSTGVKDDEKVSDSESVLEILSDVSESSEYVFGVMCKSPISVITEKTEESGQDKHSLELSTHVSDQEGNSIDFTSPTEENKYGRRHSTPKKFCEDKEKFVQNLEVKWNKPSEAEDEVDMNCNKSNPSQISRFSQGAKVKKLEMSFRPRSPPFPGNIGLSPGPIRTNNLKKNNSKSMSNLIFSQEVTKGNKNWSLSTENLSSQVNSPRVYSLSPSHNAKKRGQYLSPRDSNNLRRRCLSAMALNDDNAKHYLQRKKAQSLSRLNQRSSSLNSITSFQRSDYSHIQSKVKQYIMEMKEKDAKNSSRVVSASSSPNKQSVHLSALNTFIIDEDLLKELSRLTHGDEENLPKELGTLHKKLVEASLDPAFVEELLRLLIHERKSRHETDKTLAALQLDYDNLLARHAEAENLIDRLRFYKDIKISKEYEVILKVKEEEDRKSIGSSRRTSPVPPSDAMHSNSEVETMHAPKAESFNLVKTTSYPVADPFVSFVDDGNALYVQEGMQCGKTNQESRSRKFVEKTETITWTKDAEELEKKLKDFALLMGSNALCEEEKKRIWKHILNVYWQVSSTYPSVMVQGTSNSSGLKLQELGQAVQLMSARFHLSLQEKDFPPSPARGQKEGRTKVFPDQSPAKRLGDDAGQLSNISVGCMKKQEVDENLSIVPCNRNKNHAGAVDVIVKKMQEKDRFSAVSGDEMYSCGGSEHNIKNKPFGPRKKEARSKKDQMSLLQSPTHSQESMKTVGALEKVKLWQATLTDPSLAPGDYDDSSESHTPSVLSLSSSQPFVPNCHEQGEGSGVLCHPQTDRIEGVESDDGLYYFKGEKKGIATKHAGNSPGGRLQRGKSWEGEAREDKEFTWPSRRGSSVTPRGRVRGAAKPRDMDSGCPGSDRSTRFSHNASLEQHDNSLRWPHLVDQYEGGLETSVHREEVNGNTPVSNSDATPKVINSTLIDGKAIVNDICNISSVESSIPVSSDSLRKAQEKKENIRTDANSNPFSRGSIHRASTIKTASTVKEIEVCKSSEGPSRNEEQDHEVNLSIMEIEEKQLQSNSSDKRRVKELDKRYRGHVSQGKNITGRGSPNSSYQGSGKSSSSSSSRTSKSPLDIHTNISRLKKDLEILKSQMLNLTGYMLKERQQQEFEDMQGSKTRRKRNARVPLKAVNPISCTDHSQSEDWESQSHDLECHSKCKERKTAKDPSCYYIEGDKWLTRSPRKQSSKRQEEHHGQVLDKTPVDQLGISEEVQEVCRCVKSVLKGRQSDQDPRSIGLRECAHQDEKRIPEPRRSSRSERVSRSSFSSLQRKSGSMDNIRIGGNESVAEEVLSNIARDANLSGLYRVPSAPGGLSTLQPAVSNPIIYIEHYNFHGGCKNKENEGTRKHSSLPSTPSKIKFRKYGSQQDLMTSLDEATLLAERLRLRSQAMLNVMRTTRLDNQASPVKRPKSARV